MREVWDKIAERFPSHNEVSVDIPDISLIDDDCFKSRFNVVQMRSQFGIFAMFSERDLKKLPPAAGVGVAVYHKGECGEFETYDNETWEGLDYIAKSGGDGDLLFIIRKDGEVCGYLAANNTYENFYDISNVFVLPEYRGMKFGTVLTGEYAGYCYKNGFIPHYGSAVSEYSEAAARNCGFTETGRTHFIKISLK